MKKEKRGSKGFIFLIFLILIIVILLVYYYVFGIPEFFKKNNSKVQNIIVENKIENVIQNDIDIADNNEINNKNVEEDNTELIQQDIDIIVKDKNKASINIKTGTLNVGGAVIIIEDKNIKKYNWTSDYKLQQKKDGNWQDMKSKIESDEMNSEIEYNDQTRMMEQKLDWLNRYGEVEVGQYRIVKEADGIEFYVYFEVQ